MVSYQPIAVTTYFGVYVRVDRDWGLPVPLINCATEALNPSDFGLGIFFNVVV